ncbi:hypothetical protein Ocin01_13774 [Orchesella cincta]|uniref:Protein sleepless n=1 Tax=Orchesella cincta TaxID=48709 RepID=A0A1D2MIV8_ORCCI|nr:hypothetical protein Ocin01_13774 [Orchesella cincta]
MTRFDFLAFFSLLLWSSVEGLSCWKCISERDDPDKEPDFNYKCDTDLTGFADDCGPDAACVAREDWDEYTGKLVQTEMYCVNNEAGPASTALPTGCLTYKYGQGRKTTLIKSCLCNHADDCNRAGLAKLHKILPTVDSDGRKIDAKNGSSSSSVPTGRVLGGGKREATSSSSSNKKSTKKRRKRKHKRKNKFRDAYISTQTRVSIPVHKKI